jgi:hypothetical protein
MSCVIQSIIFYKKYNWDKKKSLKWLLKQDIIPIKDEHIINNRIRYRIQEPNFDSYITKKISNGIDIIFGYNYNNYLYKNLHKNL